MNNFEFLDLITIFSFVIGYENYLLNIKQSQQLENHLSKQDNELLQKILKQNEEILAKLNK